jgi:hypothetical protein
MSDKSPMLSLREYPATTIRAEKMDRPPHFGIIGRNRGPRA